ncbi:MAG: methylmalonyl Co-A mutase-associated GTPase MeaB [Candidatus Caldarchaeum sp.]|uniref:Methylmalonyl Co-A mutase-associated GTPase MeaB n=1 Tax=Caldiarchaeum subterraneum TaxID=311458 RepID=A0A7C5L8K7_CALS0
MAEVDRLAKDVLAGDVKALAKAISIVELYSAEAEELLSKLFRHVGGKPVIGFSGPPGSGKSTLIGRVVEHLTGRGFRVGVLAIDPSSPFTGGAVLGDRVRMAAVSSRPGVFIRSMATKGVRGSVAVNVRAVLRVFDAAGFDFILVETAGAGQADVSVNDVADIVVIVVTPDMGDSIQAIKAGLLEVGDVYVVNKADDVRGSLTAAMLETMLSRKNAKPTVLKTVATRGEGVDVLAETLLKTWEDLNASGEIAARRRRQTVAEVITMMMESVRIAAEKLASNEQFAAEVEKLVAAGLEPRAIARLKIPLLINTFYKTREHNNIKIERCGRDWQR